VSKDYINPNTNSKILTTLNLTLTDPHDAKKENYKNVVLGWYWYLYLEGPTSKTSTQGRN